MQAYADQSELDAINTAATVAENKDVARAAAAVAMAEAKDAVIRTALNTAMTGSTTRTRSPGAKLRKNGNQLVAHSTYTTLVWDENFDANNVDATVWGGVSNKSRLVAPVTGRYTVAGVCVFATNTNGWRIAALRKNGVNVDFVSAAPVSGTSSCVPFAWPEVYLNAGDYIEIQVNHGSGAGTNLNVGSAGGIDSTCALSYIGPV
jgi:hypothetical protein